MTDADLIADANRWASKRLYQGKPRAEVKHTRNGWQYYFHDDIPIGGSRPFFGGEDAAWMALGKLLQKLREELE